MATNPTDADRQTPLERLPTGIPGLDIVLRGGLLKAGIYIVRGQPGTGKTILGNQFCFNHVATGHRAVYVTLLAETHDRMMQHMQVMSFFDPTRIPDGLYYVNGFRVLEEDGLKGFINLFAARNSGASCDAGRPRRSDRHRGVEPIGARLQEVHPRASGPHSH